MNKNLRVIVSLKNNILAKKREELGFNQAQMAEFCKVSQQQYGNVENLKEYPWNKLKDTWTTVALKISKAIYMLPEDIWPDIFSKITKRKTFAEVDAYSMFSQLRNDNGTPQSFLDSKELRKDVKKMVNTLTPREQKVIELRFGLNGGEPKRHHEIASFFGVSNNRISQMEKKAFRKLRHPARNKRVKQYIDDGRAEVIERDNHYSHKTVLSHVNKMVENNCSVEEIRSYIICHGIKYDEFIEWRKVNEINNARAT